MVRAPCEPRIQPNEPPSPLLGASSMGVFVKFMNSALNSRCLDSVNGNDFCRLKSIVCNPGPRIVATPQFPNVPTVGCENADGLTH